MEEIFTSKKLKILVSKIKEPIVVFGVPMYKVLEENGFPKYITSALGIGSESGNMLQIIKKLIFLVSNKIKTTKSIKKLLLEPKIIGGFLFIYFLYTMFFFVPQSKQLLSFSNPEKFPEITKTLLGWSDYANEHQIIFVIKTLFVVAIIVFILKFIFKFLQRIVPFLQRIRENQELSLLFNVLTVALYANVQLNQALRQASDIIDNKEVKKQLIDMSKAIEIGHTFSSQLERFKYPRPLISRVKAGEKASKSATSFEKIAIKYQEMTEESVELAIAFIKPISLIIAATVMVTIYFGVNAPLLNIGG